MNPFPRMSPEEIALMKGHGKPAKPCREVVFDQKIIVTTPYALITWAKSRGTALDMGNVYLGSLWMKENERKFKSFKTKNR